MTTLVEARDGLKAMLGSIDGLRPYHYIPEDLMPPAAIVMPPVTPDMWGDLGGESSAIRFPILFLVPSTIDRQQVDLYEFLEKTGPRSVFAAVQADRSLGGLEVDARVTGFEDFDTERFGLINYFGRVVNVDLFIT